MSKLIKTFTNADLDRAAKAVDEDRAYGEEARLIKACFNLYSQNTSREIVAMKIGVIDVTNSTNISRYKSKISVPELVDTLLAIKDLDARIAAGDISLVQEIAVATKNKYDINLFSFASKFCCYHNIFIYCGDAFSFYDTVLHDYIPMYAPGVSKRQLNICRESCDYKRYVDFIDGILDANGITTESRRRKFDNLVWYYNRKRGTNNEL